MGKMKNVVIRGKPKSVKKRVAVMATMQKRKKKPAKASSSGLLGQLGFGVGSLLGGPAGGLTGMAAGKLISKITGFGDYTVDRNSISNGNSVPTFTNGGKGMRVMHREFITDIVGSVEFTNHSYSINPGLVTTFPWLSLIAADFEEFEMCGLVAEYRPTSGTAISSNSSALGVVVLATQYDALDPPFTTKQQMESYEYATSTVPFSGCIHPIECLSKLNVLGSQFIRTGDVPVGADVRLYDIGNFQIATKGMQSAYVVGEFWWSYDVLFRKPRLPPTISLPSYARFSSGLPDAATATPLGLAPSRLSDSTLAGITVQATNIKIENPGDYYLSMTQYTSTSGTVRDTYFDVFGSNISTIAGFQPTTQFMLGAVDTAQNVSCSNIYLRVLASGVGSANQITLGAGSGMDLAYAFLTVTLLRQVPLTRVRTQVRCTRPLIDDFVDLNIHEEKFMT